MRRESSRTKETSHTTRVNRKLVSVVVWKSMCLHLTAMNTSGTSGGIQWEQEQKCNSEAKKKTFPRFPNDSRRRLCFTDRLKAILFLTPRNNLDGADVILIHSLTVWCSRHCLTTLFGSLRWFSIQCFTSSCWSRFLAPQNGHTNVDRFGILLHIKGHTHTHTQIITRLG